MAQVRRVAVCSVEKERITVNLEALIVVQPGVLTKAEVDQMRRVVASKLMVFAANEIPYLNIHLSDIKVSR